VASAPSIFFVSGAAHFLVAGFDESRTTGFLSTTADAFASLTAFVAIESTVPFFMSFVAANPIAPLAMTLMPIPYPCAKYEGCGSPFFSANCLAQVAITLASA
jgi:hypothetical protein